MFKRRHEEAVAEFEQAFALQVEEFLAVEQAALTGGLATRKGSGI